MSANGKQLACIKYSGPGGIQTAKPNAAALHLVWQYGPDVRTKQPFAGLYEFEIFAIFEEKFDNFGAKIMIFDPKLSNFGRNHWHRWSSVASLV